MANSPALWSTLRAHNKIVRLYFYFTLGSAFLSLWAHSIWQIETDFRIESETGWEKWIYTAYKPIVQQNRPDRLLKHIRSVSPLYIQPVRHYIDISFRDASA